MPKALLGNRMSKVFNLLSLSSIDCLAKCKCQTLLWNWKRFLHDELKEKENRKSCQHFLPAEDFPTEGSLNLQFLKALKRSEENYFSFKNFPHNFFRKIMFSKFFHLGKFNFRWHWKRVDRYLGLLSLLNTFYCFEAPV